MTKQIWHRPFYDNELVYCFDAPRDRRKSLCERKPDGTVVYDDGFEYDGRDVFYAEDMTFDESRDTFEKRKYAYIQNAVKEHEGEAEKAIANLYRDYEIAKALSRARPPYKPSFLSKCVAVFYTVFSIAASICILGVSAYVWSVW